AGQDVGKAALFSPFGKNEPRIAPDVWPQGGPGFLCRQSSHQPRHNDHYRRCRGLPLKRAQILPTTAAGLYWNVMTGCEQVGMFAAIIEQTQDRVELDASVVAPGD